MFAPAGPCVWGPRCRVPATQGHFCRRCATCSHSACTYANVRALDEEAPDTPGCPVCSNVPGVQDSILQQGGIEAVVSRISGEVSRCGASGTPSTPTQSDTPSRGRRVSKKPVTDALDTTVTSGRKRTASTPGRARNTKRGVFNVPEPPTAAAPMSEPPAAAAPTTESCRHAASRQSG